MGLGGEGEGEVRGWEWRGKEGKGIVKLINFSINLGGAG